MTDKDTLDVPSEDILSLWEREAKREEPTHIPDVFKHDLRDQRILALIEEVRRLTPLDGELHDGIEEIYRLQEQLRLAKEIIAKKDETLHFARDFIIGCVAAGSHPDSLIPIEKTLALKLEDEQ